MGDWSLLWVCPVLVWSTSNSSFLGSVIWVVSHFQLCLLFSCVSFYFCLFGCVSFTVVSPIQLCLLLLLSFRLCLIFSCVSYSVVSHFTSVISLVSVFGCISFSVVSHFASVISLVSVLVSDFSHSTSELSGQFRTRR